MLYSPWFIPVASVVFPPAGIVLLWLRAGTRPWKKLAGSALIAGWSVAYMMIFFGLHFQLDGSGIRPVPTFDKREAHWADLERSRASQIAAPVIEAAARPAQPADTGSSQDPRATSVPAAVPTGPIFVDRIATAVTTSLRSARIGPRKDCLSSGDSRSGEGMPPS